MSHSGNTVEEKLEEDFLDALPFAFYSGQVLPIDADSLCEVNQFGLVQAILYSSGSRLSVQGRLANKLADGHSFQSVRFHRDEIGSAIRSAYETQDPNQALTSVGKLWEISENNCRLAEARYRQLLPCVNLPEKPKCSLPPIETSEIKVPFNSKSHESANRLLASMSCSEFEKPTVTIGNSANLILTWQIGKSRVQLEFEPCDLPWPGIKVRMLKLDKLGVSSGIYYNAIDLLNDLREGNA